jgi:hypothetical protein
MSKIVAASKAKTAEAQTKLRPATTRAVTIDVIALASVDVAKREMLTAPQQTVRR